MLYPRENKLECIQLLVVCIIKFTIPNLYGEFKSYITTSCHPQWWEMEKKQTSICHSVKKIKLRLD